MVDLEDTELAGEGRLSEGKGVEPCPEDDVLLDAASGRLSELILSESAAQNLMGPHEHWYRITAAVA